MRHIINIYIQIRWAYWSWVRLSCDQRKQLYWSFLSTSTLQRCARDSASSRRWQSSRAKLSSCFWVYKKSHLDVYQQADAIGKTAETEWGLWGPYKCVKKRKEKKRKRKEKKRKEKKRKEKKKNKEKKRKEKKRKEKLRERKILFSCLGGSINYNVE